MQDQIMLSNHDLNIYIQNITKTEENVYRLKEVSKSLASEISEIESHEKPQEMQIDKPEEYNDNLMIDDYKKKIETTKKLLIIVALIVVICCMYRTIDAHYDEYYYTTFGDLLLTALIGLVIGLCFASLPAFFFSVRLSVQKDAMSKIEAENEIARRQYENKMTEYETAVFEAKKKYKAEQEAYLQAQTLLPSLKQDLINTNNALRETENVLAQLYSLDVIFPKYRGYIPMTTICEYFSSGRVTELTGKDGAYNLYENEVRQNMIINNLAAIQQDMHLLEKIKDNQYLLYNSMKETSRLLSSIGYNISATQRSAAITAEQSRIAAKNTNTLKWMKLILG